MLELGLLILGLVVGATVARVWWYREVLTLRLTMISANNEFIQLLNAKDATIAELTRELTGAEVQ